MCGGGEKNPLTPHSFYARRHSPLSHLHGINPILPFSHQSPISSLLPFKPHNLSNLLTVSPPSPLLFSQSSHSNYRYLKLSHFSPFSPCSVLTLLTLLMILSFSLFSSVSPFSHFSHPSQLGSYLDSLQTEKSDPISHGNVGDP